MKVRLAGYDRLDRPVFIIRFGAFKAAAMRNSAPIERWVWLHVWAQEHAVAECAARTARVGHLVEARGSIVMCIWIAA